MNDIPEWAMEEAEDIIEMIRINGPYGDVAVRSIAVHLVKAKDQGIAEERANCLLLLEQKCEGDIDFAIWSLKGRP